MWEYASLLGIQHRQSEGTSLFLMAFCGVLLFSRYRLTSSTKAVLSDLDYTAQDSERLDSDAAGMELPSSSSTLFKLINHLTI